MLGEISLLEKPEKSATGEIRYFYELLLLVFFIIVNFTRHTKKINWHRRKTFFDLILV